MHAQRTHTATLAHQNAPVVAHVLCHSAIQRSTAGEEAASKAAADSASAAPTVSAQDGGAAGGELSNLMAQARTRRGGMAERLARQNRTGAEKGSAKGSSHVQKASAVSIGSMVDSSGKQAWIVVGWEAPTKLVPSVRQPD